MTDNTNGEILRGIVGCAPGTGGPNRAHEWGKGIRASMAQQASIINPPVKHTKSDYGAWHPDAGPGRAGGTSKGGAVAAGVAGVIFALIIAASFVASSSRHPAGIAPPAAGLPAERSPGGNGDVPDATPYGESQPDVGSPIKRAPSNSESSRSNDREGLPVRRTGEEVPAQVSGDDIAVPPTEAPQATSPPFFAAAEIFGCSKPGSPQVPDGTTATKTDLDAANAQFYEYQRGIDHYQDCLNRFAANHFSRRPEANAALEDSQREKVTVANAVNEAVHTYNATHAG